MPKSKAFDTVRFRLVVLSSGIIALTTLTSFIVLYGFLTRNLMANLDASLATEMREFRSIMDMGGFGEMRKEVEMEEVSSGKHRVFIRIIDASGNDIASSDLQNWAGATDPPSLLPMPGRPHFDSLELPEQGISVRRVFGEVSPGVWALMGVDNRDALELLATFRAICIEVFVLSLIVCVLGAWIIARRAMRGVDVVVEAAELVTTGSLHSRISAKGYGREIERLADVLNRMLARINELIQETRVLNDNIAHEMRSPLTRIRGNAELLLTHEGGTEQSRDMTASIVEACDGMLSTINSMLDISEMESGAAKLSTDPVDLGKLAIETCDLFQPATEDRGITLTIESEPTVIARGDALRLRRALANLLDNAIKYTPSNGSITVQVTGEPDEAVLRVTDTGVGIAEEELPRIFDRFFRGDRSRTQPGNGLGLGMVRAIVTAHGGEVRIASTVGVGTSCEIRLPRATK